MIRIVFVKTNVKRRRRDKVHLRFVSHPDSSCFYFADVAEEGRMKQVLVTGY